MHALQREAPNSSNLAFDSFFSAQLSFPNNALTDDSMDCLVKLLSGVCKVTHLDLTNNLLTCDGAKRLGQHIHSTGHKCHITNLNLAMNNIKDPGTTSLCKVFLFEYCSANLIVNTP